ncbi:MAG TPA: hypothetical protein VFE42_10575 [Chloroflexota bacterium]|nr:hypothetical protein [Chloroflexota bacterium]
MKSLPDRLNAPDVAVWDDLVDRLKALDVRYLSGGSAWDGRVSHYPTAQDVPIAQLIADLASGLRSTLPIRLCARLGRCRRSTALSKIERGLQRDIADALAWLEAGQISRGQLVAAFEEIVPRLEREAVPRVQESDFRRKLAAFRTLAERTDEAPRPELPNQPNHDG